MRNKTSFWMQLLAVLLSFVMVLGIFSFLGENLASEAEVDPDAQAEEDQQTNIPGDYITLPITIRDFAADGMLFEYNEVDRGTFTTRNDDGTPTWDTPTTVNKTDRLSPYTGVAYTATYNPTYWSLSSTDGVWSATGDYTGIRIYPASADIFKSSDGTQTSGANWYCFIVDQYGGILKVLDFAAEKTDIATVMTSVGGSYSVWAWRDASNIPAYNLISKVTEDNRSQYRFTFATSSSAGATVDVYLGLCYYENAMPESYGYTGIYVIDGNYVVSKLTSLSYYDSWHFVVVNTSNNNVVQVIPNGTSKTSLADYCTAQYKFVLAWNANSNKQFYDLIAPITTENYSEYQIVTVTSTVGAALFVERPIYVNEANTKGFGLLQTSDKDWINDLTTTSGPGTYVNNGSYNSSAAPDSIPIALNSGAEQTLHGALIRYDLVGSDLVNDKPAYTKDTITYLANYMSKIMNEPWQNADGSYNSFFVMGTKMFDQNENYVGPDASNAVYDLAQILRRHVTGGLGDYDTTIAHADELYDATQCETWFDAAYYLLHYTWRDSSTEDNGNDGYGKYVPEYDSLHLVAKTKDDGSVYYVFNSGYDNTAYDPVNGEIYNTQTANITAALYNGSAFYTRGNLLPAARFDPLGYSGTKSTGTAQWLGYGDKAGGNTYGDLTGASATQTWDDYYDTTNYHLSLEGHAEFVYHYSSNLYFTFTGDDDVYLYINDKRVLDLGGAHSVVKATINMNDVAELCGLQEGQTCSFDFFYLERHGTAANFSIETNIQLAQSGMITTKQGYQNGVSTGYGGPVDPSKPVSYSFTLTNSSAATLTNLTFKDTQLGVTLSPSEIDLNDESSLESMYVYVRDENNAIVRSYSAATETPLTADVLQDELRNGLPSGYSMTIYNLRYTIPDEKWEADDTFTNVVNTTALANGKELRGTADWKVQKQDLNAQPFHIYNWVHKGAKATEWTPRDVSVTKAELIQPAKNAGADFDDSSADIVLCNGAGLENSALWSTDYTNVIANLTLGNDDSMTYNSKIPGMVTIYYKINGISYNDHVFHFNVITYGVADNIYVLDYGLAVELNGDDFGLRVNDHLTVSENIHATNVTITGIQNATSNYGEFTWDQVSSLKYTPKKIIDNIDSVQVNVRVLETGATEVTKFTGVDMSEIVTTAPASVVYYEENFPGISYFNNNGNQWVDYETVDENDKSVAGTEQSADQDMNYGSDPNYKEDKEGVLQSDGLGGGDSNGTVNKLEVKQTAEVMSFDFTGTGFEIISRTTNEEYAVIDVQVRNSSGEIVEQKPVITESKGGDLYQIPIISFTSPTRDTYHVVVKAGTTGNVDRVFYVDGIRIYGPLNDNQAQEYYNPAESQAEFFEVKQMIDDDKMSYADLYYNDESVKGFMTGTTMVEDTTGTGAILKAVDDVDEYLSVGPNNELYMDGNSNVSVLTFILTPDANCPEAARTLQIGAHRKANSNLESMGYSLMTYATDVQDIYEDLMGFVADERSIPETNAYIITSGTEMYYTIELDKLTPRDDGSYQIMIAAVGSEFGDTNLALTNIKVAGYTVTAPFDKEAEN